MSASPSSRWLLILAVVAAAGAAALGWWRWQAGRAAAPVRQITVSGNIEAHESVLSFKTVQSRIVKLPFNEGQWVSKDTPLAALDDADYQQQIAIASANYTLQQRQSVAARGNVAVAERSVAAAEAELAQRRMDHRRLAALAGQGFVSAAALEQARTALSVAEAALARERALRAVALDNVKTAQAGSDSGAQALRLARIVHGYTVLRAPFDGVITVRQAELGEVVLPGAPVLTLADLDHVWLRAYANESDLGKIRLGQRVAVRTDSHPGKQYQGHVSFIASKAEFTPKSVETHAERVALVYRLKIALDNPQHELLPGMPADARIALRPEQP